jgi:hypothetical protein
VDRTFEVGEVEKLAGEAFVVDRCSDRVAVSGFSTTYKPVGNA